MLERGGFSFIALLVINPIAILLYQNCSFIPVSQSEVVSREMTAQKRVISSVHTPEKIDIHSKNNMARSATEKCGPHQKNCPSSKIE